jgi:hypothetical protein
VLKKKECTAIACAEQEGMWNVLWNFEQQMENFPATA